MRPNISKTTLNISGLNMLLPFTLNYLSTLNVNGLNILLGRCLESGQERQDPTTSCLQKTHYSAT